MAYDWLKGVADEYDVIVIGSGLGGLTGANVLAKAGHRVLLLEHHYQFGGLATWFTRKGGHIFDISLHGFPIGMIKSCRKYWTKEIADSIVPLKDIRFVNPQMDVWTTFTREDYTRVLVEERDGGKVACGIVAGNGRVIRAKAVLSNANIKNTIFRLAGEENFPRDYLAAAQAVRINSSSCQVYLGIRKGESIPHIGDLVFTSENRNFSSAELTDFRTTSRTFSVYY